MNWAVTYIFGLVNRSFVNLISDSDSDFENDPSVQRILFTSSNMKEETDRYTIHLREFTCTCMRIGSFVKCIGR